MYSSLTQLICYQRMRFKFHNLRGLSYDIPKIMELMPSIQTYDWGKPGNTSKVATLFKNVNPDFVIEPHKTYAELWMGTHVNGPSVVKNSNKSLLSVITEQPEYLGDSVQAKFGKNLPYLLKVLSIQQALSIQIHPSKNHAEKLHVEQPQYYKDPNHKPELAVALTPLEALCGFRPYAEICTFFRIIPELRELIGDNLCEEFIKQNSETALKQCFCALMKCSPEKIKKSFVNIFQRFSSLDRENRETQLTDLFERLYKQYPDDIGCFVIYFLNFLRLKPLEAIYLRANLPHAYLFGDCVECMACSDNVVRCGLTPKFKDVSTLCEMVDCHGESASAMLFKPIVENEFTVVFKPPVPDFALAMIQVPNGTNELSLLPRDSGSILLVISGTAVSDYVKLFAGASVFIPAKHIWKLQHVSKEFVAFQAMANV